MRGALSMGGAIEFRFVTGSSQLTRQKREQDAFGGPAALARGGVRCLTIARREGEKWNEIVVSASQYRRLSALPHVALLFDLNGHQLTEQCPEIHHYRDK